MPSISSQEREHIIRWSDDPDEPLNVYTHRQAVAKRLLAGGATLVRVSKIEGREVSWTLVCPRAWIRWPLPRKKREVPAEARELSRARVRAAGGIGKRTQNAPSMPAGRSGRRAGEDNSAGTDSDPSEGR